MVVVSLQSCAGITTIEFQDIFITPEETHVIVSPMFSLSQPSASTGLLWHYGLAYSGHCIVKQCHMWPFLERIM